MTQTIVVNKGEAAEKLRGVVGKIQPKWGCGVEKVVPTPKCERILERGVVDTEEFIKHRAVKEIENAANHIATCEYCKRMIAEMKTLDKNLIETRKEYPVPEGLLKKIEKRIAEV